MSKRENTNALIEAVGGVVAEEAPKLVADGLSKLAGEQEDTLAASVLLLISGVVRTHGSTAIDNVAANVQALIDGDPMAVMRLKSQGADALALSQLVDQLQSAEADRKRAAGKLASHVGAALANIVRLVSKATIAALTRG